MRSDTDTSREIYYLEGPKKTMTSLLQPKTKDSVTTNKSHKNNQTSNTLKQLLLRPNITIKKTILLDNYKAQNNVKTDIISEPPVKKSCKTAKQVSKTTKQACKTAKTQKGTVTKYVDRSRSLLIPENTEYYPDKQKRNVQTKKIVLQPKHDYKVVAATNKRKRRSPHRELETPPPEGSNPAPDVDMEMSIEDLVRQADEEGMDDEDFMEILTCPSPVWWEGDDEETSINIQEYIDEENSLTQENGTTNDCLKEKSLKTDVNFFKKFVQKRSQLETVLGNIKCKKNPELINEINIKESDKTRKNSTNSDGSINEELLNTLENIEIPIQDVKSEDGIDIQNDAVTKKSNSSIPKLNQKPKRKRKQARRPKKNQKKENEIHLKTEKIQKKENEISNEIHLNREKIQKKEIVISNEIHLNAEKIQKKENEISIEFDLNTEKNHKKETAKENEISNEIRLKTEKSQKKEIAKENEISKEFHLKTDKNQKKEIAKDNEFDLNTEKIQKKEIAKENEVNLNTEKSQKKEIANENEISNEIHLNTEKIQNKGIAKDNEFDLNTEKNQNNEHPNDNFTNEIANPDVVPPFLPPLTKIPFSYVPKSARSIDIIMPGTTKCDTIQFDSISDTNVKFLDEYLDDRHTDKPVNIDDDYMTVYKIITNPMENVDVEEQIKCNLVDKAPPKNINSYKTKDGKKKVRAINSFYKPRKRSLIGKFS